MPVATLAFTLALALGKAPPGAKVVKPPPEARQRPDAAGCASWVVLAPGASVLVRLKAGLARVAVTSQRHWDLRPLGGTLARIVAGEEGESTIIAWLADGSRLTVCVTVREKAPTRVLGSAMSTVSEEEAARAQQAPSGEVRAKKPKE